ncbi:MAG TPA: TonB family protein [Candidatus Angelobacter sp.]|nr:TonB family protein [Candidatus Angelobacter sp.]
MRNMRNWAKIVSVALLTIKILSAQATVVLSDEANRHLVKRVQAIYPEMAQIAHITGEVTLRFTISETGEVTDVQPVSGHPLLIQAAQAAVRQWRYTPFKAGGHGIPVITSVVVEFPQGVPLTLEDRVKEERKKRQFDRFSSDLLACMLKVEKRQIAEAEPLCRRAVEASRNLGPQDQLFRMEACEYIGHVLLAQGKTTEALENYEEELRIARKENENREYDLAEAQVNLGNAKRDLDDLKSAGQHYQEAENLYRQISKGTALDLVKKQSAYAFWQVLRSHAEMLRQMGQPDAASSLEHEAAGIVIEEGAPSNSKP